ncbi:MAG TPA: hypothetical protein VMS93_12920 [Candidatus Saccharimonadales bacterium]|nr:hypothetical protein [Candidatus Saccharimonadales bacterium]
MRPPCLVPLVFALAALAAPAAAQTVSLGANLDFSLYHPIGSGSTSAVVGLPGNSYGYQPGLRVGVSTRGPVDVYLDASFLYSSRGSTGAKSLYTSLNGQYNFHPDRSCTPFVTAGAGLVHVGGSTYGSTSAVVGGGAGIREKVSQGHAALRQEVRFDFLSKSSYVSKSILLGARLGFDFWLD